MSKQTPPNEICLKRDEYYSLKEKLDEVDAALRGKCNDIDCDRYIFKRCLKKEYKPVLKHGFSCIPSLKMEKETIMRIISLPRYRKFRYKKCVVCRKELDTLGKDSTIVGFVRPSCIDNKMHEYKGVYAHRKCRRKVIIPKGWKKAW